MAGAVKLEGYPHVRGDELAIAQARRGMEVIVSPLLNDLDAWDRMVARRQELIAAFRRILDTMDVTPQEAGRLAREQTGAIIPQGVWI
jgi:hypothetical protein